MRSLNKRFVITLASLLLSFALTVCACGGFSFLRVSGAETAQELQEELDELTKKQKEIEKKLSSLKSDISNKKEIRIALEEKIANAQTQIDVYNQQILLLQKQVDESKEAYDKAAVTFNTQLNIFKARLRAMYMTGNTSYLTMLLSADDFADYLYKSKLVESVSAKDKELLDSMQKEYKKISSARNSLKKKQKSLETAQTKLAKQQVSLQAQYNELENLIRDLEDQQAALVEDSEEAAKAKAEVEKELAEAARNTGGLVYSGEAFLWPCPGYYKLSSKFKPANRPGHTGIDISSSGIYGKPIIAAADGTVTQAGDKNNGYGIYIIINHGKNKKDGKVYTTLYGHCSSIVVKKDQFVKAGTVIGYVGSTGNSTGPHLHFEVRINNTPVNPMNYYS